MMRDISAVVVDHVAPAPLTLVERATIARIVTASSEADGYDPVADLKQTLSSAPPARRKRYKALGFIVSVMSFWPSFIPVAVAHHMPPAHYYDLRILVY
jgi:hypothetical protein